MSKVTDAPHRGEHSIEMEGTVNNVPVKAPESAPSIKPFRRHWSQGVVLFL